MREICLDTETTGLNPKDGHKIIEIACVEMIDKVKTGKVFHSYINPRRDVPQEAFAVHGISTDFLQDKPIFDHIANKFLDFVKDATIVIHNAAFDTKFINYELGIIGLKPLNMENIVDSLAIARKKFPGAQASLDALCKRFNIDSSHRTKHGALLDTELLCDVYVELMGGAQTGFGFESEEVRTKQKSQNDIILSSQEKPTLPSRNFPLSEKELELHKDFILQNFKSNLWGY